MKISQDLRDVLADFYHSNKKLTILTGAGVSAESGIPTFRGPEGYWRIGSENYKPQTIGTYEMFRKNPNEVWKWFLFRRTVCQKAKPNAGHDAIVELEQLFGDRFTLITQNVDGLHLRAGNSLERTFLIHGSLEFMRCGEECTRDLYPFPEGIGEKTRESAISYDEWALLTCPRCGALTRPHVLWFDETYDEEYYRFQSSWNVALETGLLITVGTSGATTLPQIIVKQVISKEEAMIDINVKPNIFSEVANKQPNGFFMMGSSGQILPELVNIFKEMAYRGTN